MWADLRRNSRRRQWKRSLEALHREVGGGRKDQGVGVQTARSAAERDQLARGSLKSTPTRVAGVGENQSSPMISFYAAAIGVMFLMFTASSSAGALLDEAESGTLERVLSTRVTMTKLLAGKLVFNTGLAFLQLVAMFLWGWAVFKLDLFSHLPGFVVMGLCTAFAVAAFGMLLASACQTRSATGSHIRR